PVQRSLAPHGHAAAASRDVAAHVLDELEEAGVALTARLDPSARVRDRDPTAEDRGRRRGIRRRRDVAGDLERAALHLLRTGQDLATRRPLRADAARPEGRQREIDERRRDERAGDAEMKAVAHARADEQE